VHECSRGSEECQRIAAVSWNPAPTPREPVTSGVMQKNPRADMRSAPPSISPAPGTSLLQPGGLLVRHAAGVSRELAVLTVQARWGEVHA
jgi:hypothetical protein